MIVALIQHAVAEKYDMDTVLLIQTNGLAISKANEVEVTSFISFRSPTPSTSSAVEPTGQRVVVTSHYSTSHSWKPTR